MDPFYRKPVVLPVKKACGTHPSPFLASQAWKAKWVPPASRSEKAISIAVAFVCPSPWIDSRELAVRFNVRRFRIKSERKSHGYRFRISS